MTCKHNASYQITQDNKTLHNKRKKELGKASEENSSCVRQEWVNNSTTPWQLHDDGDDDNDKLFSDAWYKVYEGVGSLFIGIIRGFIR